MEERESGFICPQKERLPDNSDESSSDEIALIPSVEWQMVEWCNYRCAYCCAGRHNREATSHSFMSDSLIEKTCRVIERLPGRWRIHFAGGECTLHPRFIEVCASLVNKGHAVSLITNFSAPMKMIKELIDRCGVGLEEMEISLHLSQVDLSKFTERLKALASMVCASTKITVYTVMIAEDFHVLRQLPEHFCRIGIPFYFQHLKNGNRFVPYPQEIEEYLREKVCRVTPFLRGRNFHGTRCHTGHLFFVVKNDGKCFRCFDLPFSLNYLGSVDSVPLKLYDQAEPCPGSACTCLRPALFGMICYGSSSSTIHQAKHQCRAFLPALRLALADRGRRLSNLAKKAVRPVIR